MSTSLSYETTSPLTHHIRDRIQIRIDSLASNYEWWCEPICFFNDPNKPTHLSGNTKLFLLLDDLAIDSFMAHADATKIAELLTSASQEFGVAWNLSFEGAHVGCISRGVIDEDGAASLHSLLEICSMMGVDPVEMNRGEILRAHPDR